MHDLRTTKCFSESAFLQAFVVRRDCNEQTMWMPDQELLYIVDSSYSVKTKKVSSSGRTQPAGSTRVVNKAPAFRVGSVRAWIMKNCRASIGPDAEAKIKFL